LLAKGEKGRADELTAEALKLAPDNRFATTARVRVLIDAKKLDEAEQILTGSAAEVPGLRPGVEPDGRLSNGSRIGRLRLRQIAAHVLDVAHQAPRQA